MECKESCRWLTPRGLVIDCCVAQRWHCRPACRQRKLSLQHLSSAGRKAHCNCNCNISGGVDGSHHRDGLLSSRTRAYGCLHDRKISRFICMKFYWRLPLLLASLLATHAAAQGRAAAAPPFFHFAVVTESSAGTSVQVIIIECQNGILRPQSVIGPSDLTLVPCMMSQPLLTAAAPQVVYPVVPQVPPEAYLLQSCPQATCSASDAAAVERSQQRCFDAACSLLETVVPSGDAPAYFWCVDIALKCSR